MELIDKAAIVAEIKKRLDELYDSLSNASDVIKDNYTKEEANITGKYTALESFENFINTLEVKEENFIWNNARTTVPEDSTNQIICIKEDGLAVSTVGKIVSGTIKWAYLDDLLNINSFNVEVKEVDLEEEINHWQGCEAFPEGVNITPLPKAMDIVERTAKHFFELGIKAQKGE